MSNVLIDRLTSIFGPPERVDNVEAFVAEMTRITAGFGADALDRAASSLIAGGGKSWPAPKAIVEACADAQEALDGAHAHRPTTARPWHFHVENAEAWARNFCQVTELGQRAFGEGWGRQVWDWAKSYARECYRHGALPEMGRRPTVDEIEYWVRRCCVPAGWMERERVVLLGERWSPETEARLNRIIAGLRAGKPFTLEASFKQMPSADPELEPQPIGSLPQRITPERPKFAPTDRDAWEARFGKPPGEAA